MCKEKKQIDRYVENLWVAVAVENVYLNLKSKIQIKWKSNRHENIRLFIEMHLVSFNLFVYIKVIKNIMFAILCRN